MKTIKAILVALFFAAAGAGAGMESAQAFPVQAWVNWTPMQATVQFYNNYGQPIDCNGMIQAYQGDGMQPFYRFVAYGIAPGSARTAFVNSTGWAPIVNATAWVDCQYSFSPYPY